ncbi:MAG: hypothetical protein K2N75_05290 [Helicobacter sp.]|uniref:hypothetical protein n=1 Tax=Helicobacter sp. TaxID=218 RepID=UPI0023C489BC|nr:hypothetical protein [Helicobacter sp.]MDE5925198.1 hypothetical protein [Helicobacter sp.]MDE7175440.1 hypothetical protein [Helicobacter sp.]
MNRREIIWQLSQYGYTKEKLESMPMSDLAKLFKQTSKERITKYMNTLRADKETEIIPGEDTNNIERELELVYHAISVEEINFAILYDAIEKILEKYDLNEAIELVLSQSSDKQYKQMTQITEVAYRSFQEILLDRIEKLCEFYPAEERFEQLKFYGDRREDINFLRESIANMSAQNNQERLSKIALLKYDIIRDYYPDSMYENYEQFYENEEEKNEIIERIMSLTKAYTRPVLKAKKFQVLSHIERVLIEDRDREKEEKALIKQYTKKLGDVILSEDELAFAMMLKEALGVLDERDVTRIIGNFDISSNPILLQRFNAIMRDNRRTNK